MSPWWMIAPSLFLLGMAVDRGMIRHEMRAFCRDLLDDAEFARVRDFNQMLERRELPR